MDKKGCAAFLGRGKAPQTSVEPKVAPNKRDKFYADPAAMYWHVFVARVSELACLRTRATTAGRQARLAEISDWMARTSGSASTYRGAWPEAARAVVAEMLDGPPLATQPGLTLKVWSARLRAHLGIMVTAARRQRGEDFASWVAKQGSNASSLHKCSNQLNQMAEGISEVPEEARHAYEPGDMGIMAYRTDQWRRFLVPRRWASSAGGSSGGVTAMGAAVTRARGGQRAEPAVRGHLHERGGGRVGLRRGRQA